MITGLQSEYRYKALLDEGLRESMEESMNISERDWDEFCCDAADVVMLVLVRMKQLFEDDPVLIWEGEVMWRNDQGGSTLFVEYHYELMDNPVRFSIPKYRPMSKAEYIARLREKGEPIPVELTGAALN